jgi:hypothetical protein
MISKRNKMPKTKDYLSENQLGALKAVQKINNEMYDKVGWQNHCDLLSITIASYYFFISININHNDFKLECPLYDSENDDRIYYKKSDKYEEWYSYLKRKFRLIKERLNLIKI